MILRHWKLAAVLLGLASGPAGAVTAATFDVRTTADLVELCDVSPKDPLAGYAITFCQAFAQGAVAVEMQHDAVYPVPMFCLPEPRPKRLETMAQFVAWARAAPDRLSLAPEEGLMTYLAEHYPCKAAH